MSRFDDEFNDYDDDEELDDEELDEEEDDDSSDKRPSTNVFGSGQPRSPMSPSGSSLGPRPSGVTGSGGPGGGSSFSGGPRSNLPGSPPSSLTGGPRPPGAGSAGPGAPSGGTLGGPRSNLPGSPPSSLGGPRPPGATPGGSSTFGGGSGGPGAPGGSSLGGGPRPGGPGSPGSGAPSTGGLPGQRPAAAPPTGGARPSDPPRSDPPKTDDKPKGGGAFGGFGGLGKKDDAAAKDGPKDAKKDDKPAGGGLLGGLGSKLPGIGGDKDKKDAPKDAKKDDKPAGGNPLGSFASKLPFGGGKDDAKDGGKKDDKDKDSKPGGGFMAGLSSRIPGMGGDKKDAPPPAAGAPKADAGGAPSPFAANRPAAGAPSSALGGGIGGAKPGLGAPPPAAKPAKDAKPAAAGGSLFSRVGSLFGGKKGDKPSRSRPSKPVKVDQGGLSLDTKLDILGVALTGISVMLLLSSLSPTQGAITGEINRFLSYLFGWGAIAVPIVMFGAGVWLILRHFGDEAPTLQMQRVIGLVVLYVTVLTFMQFIEAFNYPPNASALIPQFLVTSRELGRGGGLIGGELYLLLISNFTELGGFAILVIPLIVGSMLTLSLSAAEMVLIAISNGRNMRDRMRQRAIRRAAERAKLEEARALSLPQPAAPAQLAAKPPVEALPAGDKPGLPAPAEVPAPLQLPLNPPQEQRTIPIRQGGRTVNAPLTPAEERATPSVPTGAGATPPAPAAPAQPAAAEREKEGQRGLGGFGRLIPTAIAGGAAAAVKALTPSEEEAPTEEKPADEKRRLGLGGIGARLPFGGRKTEDGGKPAEPAANTPPAPAKTPAPPPATVVTPPAPVTPAPAASAAPPADETKAPPIAAPAPPQTPPPVSGTVPPPAAASAAPKPAEAPSPRLGDLLRSPGTPPTAAAPARPGSEEAPKPASPPVGGPSSLRPQPFTPTPQTAPGEPPKRDSAPFGGTPPPKPAEADAKPASEEPEDDWTKLPPAKPRGEPVLPPKPAAPTPFAPRVMPSKTEGPFGSSETNPVPAEDGADGANKTPAPAAAEAKPAAPLSWQERMAALSNKLPGAPSTDKPADDDKPKAEEKPTEAAPASPADKPVIPAASASPVLSKEPPSILGLDDEDEEDIDDLDDDELEDDLPLNRPAGMKPLSTPSPARPNPFAPPPRPASPAFGKPDTPATGVPMPSRFSSAPPASPTPAPSTPPARVEPPAALKPETPQPSPALPPAASAAPPPPEAPRIIPAAAAAPTDGGAPEPPPPPRRGRKEWRVPDPTSLLATGMDQELDHAMLLQRAKTIEETLQSFGAPGRVVEVRTGPVITQFGVEPDYLTVRGGKKVRVKVGAIAQLDKDLQLSLGAKSIRIEAPVPGKGYVGIEVPNDQASVVRLRDVMESDQFRKIKSPLAIALGQGVDGTPVAADLTGMPHLLIAGTTGSGKSVCVNSIIASLLLENSPERLKFIMVDPKRVELTAYNGIPHLVAPVVVELERIVGVLKWVTREMDERYRRFSSAGARNIEDFNKHLPAGEILMPYIVVIIDELADLMMLAPEETERVITRLAALARATGIHLVIATQRPSVDVVTGLIKANFPARIAFAVAGSVDSRVILDQPGAERLLGRGDMLYMSGDSPAPQRLQGVYVSDTEINNITRYWRQQMDDADLAAQARPALSNFSLDEMGTKDAADKRGTAAPVGIGMGAGRSQQQAFWDRESGPASFVSTQEPRDEEDEDGDGEDDMYDEAVTLVRQLKKASVSLLQRRLRIGYTRAAKLIDLMEERGIVGPAQSGSTPREVIG